MAFSGQKTITIDHTKCGASDSTDFPVLFAGTYAYLATVANGGSVTSSSGHDICFYSDSGLTTALDWELVEYDPTTGKIEAHVRVGTLSASTDTVIYVAYGDSGISTFQGDVAGTWDSNFKLVSHLPDGTTLTADDSTTNGNDGTVTGAVAATGKVGGCASFDGSGDKIDFGSSASVDDMTTLTLEAWVRRDTIAGTADRYLLSKAWDDGSGFGGWWFYIRRASDGTNGGKVFFARAWSGSTFDSAIWRGATKINTTSAWYRLVVTYDGASTANDPTIYINGVAETLTESQSPSGTLLSDAAYQILAGDSLYGSNVLDGFLDEIRVSNVVRSANYVLASYNNLNDPSTFYAVTGTTVVEATAASTGTATGTGVAAAVAVTVGSSVGGSTAAGLTAAVGVGVAASTGAATGAAVAAAVSASGASAAGTSTDIGVSGATAGAVAASVGVAAGNGITAATVAALAASAGLSTPAAITGAIAAAVGSSAGASTALADASDGAAGSDASSSGSSTCTGVGGSIAISTGASAGVAATSGVAATIVAAVASASSSSSCAASAAAVVGAVGASDSTSAVNGAAVWYHAALAASSGLAVALADAEDGASAVLAAYAITRRTGPRYQVTRRTGPRYDITRRTE